MIAKSIYVNMQAWVLMTYETHNTLDSLANNVKIRYLDL